MGDYAGASLSVAVLAALFVALIPTTIGALLSAIGIAGMNRLVRRNVLATSGRAVEAAGDVSVLLLDKTGTITLGNRQAARFLPVDGVEERELAEAAQLASLADETPEGRSIVVLAKERFGLREHDLGAAAARFVPFIGRDAHERRRRSPTARCARARRTPSSASSSTAAARCPSASTSSSTTSRAAAPPRSWWPTARRALGVVRAQGRRQAGHPRALRRPRAAGHPHGDDHRRQPADRGGDRRRGRAWTTSWPRPRPRPSSR